MVKTIIAGYVIPGAPIYSRANGEKTVTLNLPIDTDRSVLNDLQDASVMEVTEPLGQEIVATQKLIGWRGIQTVRAKNTLQYMITWAIPNPDETDKLKEQIAELEIQNENLIEVILDLAAYVGGEKEG